MCFTNLHSGDFLDPNFHITELDYFYKEFYLAYHYLPQELLNMIWKIDHEKKEIHFKADEQNIKIMPYIVEQKIVAFLAFQPHIANIYLQYMEFGFPFQQAFEHQTIEALTFFNTTNSLQINQKINSRVHFIEKIVAPTLNAMNYFTCIGTCTEKILRYYLIGGFSVLAQNEINGQKRFLIKKS